MGMSGIHLEDRTEFKISQQLCSELVSPSTRSIYNPEKELLEVIGKIAHLDIQLVSHGAKFFIKTCQKTKGDRTDNLPRTNTSRDIRKMVNDGRIFGLLKAYSWESTERLICRSWNSRLKTFLFCDHFSFFAKISGALIKHLNKSRTKSV